MQLKHKNKTVFVTLTKPERKKLEQAADLISAVSLLPCDQQDSAVEALNSLETLLKAFRPDEAEE